MIRRRRDARLYRFVVLEKGRHEGLARSRSHTVERSRSGRLSHWPVLPRPILGGPAKAIVTLRLQAPTRNSAEDWKSRVLRSGKRLTAERQRPNGEGLGAAGIPRPIGRPATAFRQPRAGEARRRPA